MAHLGKQNETEQLASIYRSSCDGMGMCSAWRPLCTEAIGENQQR